MKKSPKRIIITILTDIAVALVILLLCAYSFMGKDRFLSFGKTDVLPDARESYVNDTVQEPENTPAETGSESDDKTDWQIKFADKFSDTAIYTENSYKSPNISIELSTDTYEGTSSTFTYHIADIYISSVDCFRTFTVGHDYESSTAFNILDINKYTGAILSINGDSCVWQSSGLIVRNGEKINDNRSTGAELVLSKNGEMKYASSYSSDEDIVNDAYQTWNFGPALLDDDGHAYHPPKADSYISKCHPRTAVGYYEPGHYCFVVVDGRQNGSDGCYLEDLGNMFESLGCTLAYNLDGGSSSMMSFNGEIVSSPSADLMSGGVRALSDTLYIKELQ